MYPPKTKDDIVAIDATKSFQPLVTISECARLSGKKTGLVFTCQFPYATPTDFAAHWYDREDYSLLARQMAHNGIDVVCGGGVKYGMK